METPRLFWSLVRQDKSAAPFDHPWLRQAPGYASFDVWAVDYRRRLSAPMTLNGQGATIYSNKNPCSKRKPTNKAGLHRVRQSAANDASWHRLFFWPSRRGFGVNLAPCTLTASSIYRNTHCRNFDDPYTRTSRGPANADLRSRAFGPKCRKQLAGAKAGGAGPSGWSRLRTHVAHPPAAASRLMARRGREREKSHDIGERQTWLTG